MIEDKVRKLLAKAFRGILKQSESQFAIIIVGIELFQLLIQLRKVVL